MRKNRMVACRAAAVMVVGICLAACGPTGTATRGTGSTSGGVVGTAEATTSSLSSAEQEAAIHDPTWFIVNGEKLDGNSGTIGTLMSIPAGQPVNVRLGPGPAVVLGRLTGTPLVQSYTVSGSPLKNRPNYTWCRYDVTVSYTPGLDPHRAARKIRDAQESYNAGTYLRPRVGTDAEAILPWVLGLTTRSSSSYAVTSVDEVSSDTPVKAATDPENPGERLLTIVADSSGTHFAIAGNCGESISDDGPMPAFMLMFPYTGITGDTAGPQTDLMIKGLLNGSRVELAIDSVPDFRNVHWDDANGEWGEGDDNWSTGSPSAGPGQ